jgi:hypothetical protein|uniref:Uncharacterized protein n=1 Tax=Picea sitchensis TaxID=3332 RepID=A0A6B9XU62_PICSI|nr:hypothetical protein Q903MT_gene5668 [Picea sitchensis]
MLYYIHIYIGPFGHSCTPLQDRQIQFMDPYITERIRPRIINRGTDYSFLFPKVHVHRRINDQALISLSGTADRHAIQHQSMG